MRLFFHRCRDLFEIGSSKRVQTCQSAEKAVLAGPFPVRPPALVTNSRIGGDLRQQ